MSRAGCCCGGGPDPGECCTVPPEYQEPGRRYRLDIQIGPWPGSGVNFSTNVGLAVCFTQQCNNDPQCPNLQRVTRARATTSKVDLTWGGGNGAFSIIAIAGQPQQSGCDPCFPWYDDPGVVGYYTEATVPGAGVDGRLEWIQTLNPNDNPSVQMTWISGTVDPLYGASVSGWMYRGSTTAGGFNVIRSCANDAPCERMYGALITAELPTMWSIPCDLFGLGTDGTRAGVVEMSALFYGCPDQDNRYNGENRYATREFLINRVTGQYGPTAGLAYWDGVDAVNGGVINSIFTYRISPPPGTTCGDPCKGGCAIGGFLYEDCPGQTYSLSESVDVPAQCPNLDPQGFWWPAMDVPHAFPDAIQIVRLPPPPPTITTTSPPSGPAAGNTTVTISGTNFIQVTDVLFGSTRCPALISNTSGNISVKSPPGTAGQTVSIVVITDGGTATRVNAFTYT